MNRALVLAAMGVRPQDGPGTDLSHLFASSYDAIMPLLVGPPTERRWVYEILVDRHDPSREYVRLVASTNSEDYRHAWIRHETACAAFAEGTAYVATRRLARDLGHRLTPWHDWKSEDGPPGMTPRPVHPSLAGRA